LVSVRIASHGLDLEEGFESLGAHALGPLQREAEGSVPGEGCQHTNGARDTEEDCVVVHLGEAVVLEKDPRVGIHVRPRVLRLAVLKKYVWHHL
jgi:hypothetical protein